MKRLMILGAGPSQLPLIRKAVELGLYVITVDYLPENIGHKFSHQYVNCSTLDREGVHRAAVENTIDGIITFASDVATPTVGYVAEKLGLPGGFARAADIMSNKAKFRRFQSDHKINSPGFVIGSHLQEITSEIDELNFPIIFKPVDSSGSRGISRVSRMDYQELGKAFTYALQYSRSKMVCIEEQVEGIDVSGDGVFKEGQFFGVVTHKHKRGFMPTGHSLPTNISNEDQKRVLSEVSETCRTLGYSDGPLDFDVRVSPERVTIIEMSPRLGGNGIPMIIERATDFSLITASVRMALGQDYKYPNELTVERSCGSLVFGSEKDGQLKNISSEEEMRSQIREIFEFVVYPSIGEQVSIFIHSAKSLGYALFDCPDPSDYLPIVDRIQEALSLQVE